MRPKSIPMRFYSFPTQTPVIYDAAGIFQSMFIQSMNFHGSNPRIFKDICSNRDERERQGRREGGRKEGRKREREREKERKREGSSQTERQSEREAGRVLYSPFTYTHTHERNRDRGRETERRERLIDKIVLSSFSTYFFACGRFGKRGAKDWCDANDPQAESSCVSAMSHL